MLCFSIQNKTSIKTSWFVLNYCFAMLWIQPSSEQGRWWWFHCSFHTLVLFCQETLIPKEAKSCSQSFTAQKFCRRNVSSRRGKTHNTDNGKIHVVWLHSTLPEDEIRLSDFVHWTYLPTMSSPAHSTPPRSLPSCDSMCRMHRGSLSCSLLPTCTQQVGPPALNQS